ncbi:uncharacterized protein RAG0_10700 [Rhynchosporium agropyri]|uniref:Uncharacterized protein n=1 Tax=Rhynchosporium agropyri TaxID=914238 RepID=A0A1E1L0X2_9HELO|nr:uncharacterized protein RAG0_10700 [Rhynchosporium agropyri]
MTQRHQNCHCPQCLRQQRYSYACPSGSSPSCHNDPYLYNHIGSPHHHLCTHHDQISRHCLNAPHLSHDNHYPIKLPHPRETYRQQHDDRAQYEEDQCPIPCPFYHDQHYQAQHENNANASPISPPAAVAPVRVVAAGRDGGVLSPQHPSQTRFPHHLKRDDQRPSKPASPGALSQNQNQNQTAHREKEREAPAWRPRPREGSSVRETKGVSSTAMNSVNMDVNMDVNMVMGVEVGAGTRES